MKDKVKKIHFIGIGGSGMGGIAEVMFNLGFEVSGSDLNPSQTVKHLKSMGLKISGKHQISNVKGSDVVVVSGAIPKNNVEIKAAQKLGIPIIPRAEMLSELMRFKKGIAVAGTHGKTSTTSMLASILSAGGMDPTYVIGGRLNSTKANAKLGMGDLFVVEADESDASFLHLNPINTIVTNIDRDHMETYQGDFDRLKKTFLDFIHQTPFYGHVFLCLDDPNIKTILPFISRKIVTYGLHRNALIQAKKISHLGNTMTFEVIDKFYKSKTFKVTINLPGVHYVRNALAAIALGLEYGVSVDDIKKGLYGFQGVARRYDVYPDITLFKKKILLVDDYGHHPTEIDAVLEATKKGYPGKKINLVFQPHRFSRTRDSYDDFIKVLSRPNKLFLFDIYSAGESEIEGISTKHIINKLKNKKTFYLPDMRAAKKIIGEEIDDQSILIIMGAGSVGNFVQQFLG